MGQRGSRDAGSYGAEHAKKAHAPPTHMEEQIMAAIQRVKKTKDDAEEKLQAFTKILLTTPKMNNVFYSVKAVFNSFDRDRTGTMSVDQLQEALSRLTMQDVTNEETREFFTEVDVYEDGRISFKEFIVCLAIGYVLNTMPALRGETGKGSGAGAGGKSAEKPKPKHKQLLKLQKEDRRPSFLMGEGPKIAEAFGLVMDAYLTFDADGKGFITQEDMHDFIVRLGARSPSKRGVAKTLREGGAAEGPVTAFLTEERMHEMDWDGNGRITYSEFVYSFLGWVGFEDDDDEDDGAGSAGASKSASRK